MQFTQKEMTVADQNSQDAVSRALAVLKDKHHIDKVCTDAMKGVPEKITIERMSGLVEDLIADSLYHSAGIRKVVGRY
jgi:hypothetical protein